MRFNKTKNLIPAALAAMSLLGCGEGVSTAKPGGNATSQPPAGTQTSIAIGNKSDRPYVRVVLVDQAGQILKEQALDCKPSATDCMVYLPTQVKQAATLLVQDAQHRMIGAYIFPSTGLGSFNNVYPNSQSTGRYLAQKLAQDYMSKEKLSAEDATRRLLAFFQNYTNSEGNSDPNTSLGDYYLHQTAASSITENEFLQKLSKQLVNWDIAKPDELPKPKKLAANSSSSKVAAAFNALVNNDVSLISAAHANTTTSSCAPELKTFLSASEGFAKAIPTAESAITGAIGIGTQVCAGAPSQEIMSALTGLQNAINSTNLVLAQQSNFEFNKAITAQNNRFLQTYEDIKAYIDKYNAFVLHNGTIKEYFARRVKDCFGCSFDVAVIEGGPTLDYILKTAPIVNKTASLESLGDLGNYFKNLNDRCESIPQGRPENFLAVRSFCNSSIMANVAYIAGTQSALLAALQDIYETLAFYESKGQNLDKFTKPTVVTTYARGYKEIKDSFEEKQTKIIADTRAQVGIGGTKTGTFNLYAGLNDDLKSNLVARECAQMGADRKQLPNITGWYAPNASESENYIQTECQQVNANDNSKHPVKARYYYLDQDDANPNDVANVLGVPIAMDFVRNDRVIERRTGTLPLINFPIALFKAPFLVAFSNDPEAGKTDGVVPAKDIKNLEFVLHNYPEDPRFMKAETPLDPKSGKTWVDFTDKSGFNHVARLIIRRIPLGKVDIACVSGDCSLSYTQQALNFKDGYRILLDKWERLPRYQLGPLE